MSLRNMTDTKMSASNPFNPRFVPITKEKHEKHHKFFPWPKSDDPKYYKVDLIAFEKKLGNKFVFSRKRFEHIKQLRKLALRNPCQTLIYPDIYGKMRTVYRGPRAEKQISRVSKNKKQVSRLPKYKKLSVCGNDIVPQYLNYVEIAPTWDQTVRDESLHNRQSLKLPPDPYPTIRNMRTATKPIPICLALKRNPAGCSQSGNRKVKENCLLKDPRGQGCTEQMEKLEEAVENLYSLWRASRSANLLRQQFSKAAENSVPIQKIVGFGCGSMVRGIEDLADSDDDDFFEEASSMAVQHMAAITIAETLNRAYARTSPGAPPVQIKLQDPLYFEFDARIWSKYYDNIEFVSDPQGFLEIDRNTLVMSACIPCDVPLMQICADIVPEGAAGFIWDREDLNEEKKKGMYRIRDRTSPRVLNMLKGYDRSDFNNHPLERELYNAIGQENYWLWSMDCFLKKRA